MRAGDARGIPVLAFLIRTPEAFGRAGKHPEGGTIYAGQAAEDPIKQPRCIDGDSLP